VRNRCVTSERRSDEVGDSLSKRDDSDSIGQSIKSDQFDEYDRRQSVVGAHEQTEQGIGGRQGRK